MNYGINELLECPICLTTLDEPRIMTNCGHTICTSCIKKMIIEFKALTKLILPCPLCNTDSSISKKLKYKTFKLNYMLINLIEKLHQDDNLSRSAPDTFYNFTEKADIIIKNNNSEESENNEIPCCNRCC